MATDALLERIGADAAYVAGGHSYYTVETHIRHLDEAKLGEAWHATTQILASDDKRLRVFHRLHAGDGTAARDGRADAAARRHQGRPRLPGRGGGRSPASPPSPRRTARSPGRARRDAPSATGDSAGRQGRRSRRSALAGARSRLGTLRASEGIRGKCLFRMAALTYRGDVAGRRENAARRRKERSIPTEGRRKGGNGHDRTTAVPCRDGDDRRAARLPAPGLGAEPRGGAQAPSPPRPEVAGADQDAGAVGGGDRGGFGRAGEDRDLSRRCRSAARRRSSSGRSPTASSTSSGR